MRAELSASVQRALSTALGGEVVVTGRRPLGGGSICDTVRLDTNRGRFVLKSAEGAGLGLFSAEASGLRALRAAASGLTVPEVVCVSEAAPAFLVLEYLEAGPAVSDFDERLGRGLAALHRSPGPAYGFETTNYCGLTPQPNTWTTSWVAFYAEHRLGFQVERAAKAGLIAAAERKRLERFIRGLPECIFEPPEGPALIHGDLWAGNLVVDAAGGPALIDPASYFAHREAELGMMRLFGGFSPRVYDAYHEAFPLEAGWRERNRIYQLYHLLNHLNLFGAGYLGQVMAIATA